MQALDHEWITSQRRHSPSVGSDPNRDWTARWWIGTCVLDTARRELLRDGIPVHVEPKVFDLIARLAEARGAMVSKAQLSEHLWPDTHVTPASLRRLVKEARRALAGDTGRLPSFRV